MFALLTAAEIAASIEFAPILLVDDAVGGFSCSVVPCAVLNPSFDQPPFTAERFKPASALTIGASVAGGRTLPPTAKGSDPGTTVAVVGSLRS